MLRQPLKGIFSLRVTSSLHRYKEQLRNLDYFLDSRDFLLQHFFNTVLEGHRGHGTRPAGAFQLHLNHPVLLHAHQFNISTVSLEHRSYFLESFDHLFLHGIYILLYLMA